MQFLLLFERVFNYLCFKRLIELSMKRKRIWLLALLALSASMQAKVYNMQALGADPSGKRILTKVMDKALRAVEKDGGGTLYFPAGRYLTGPIHMVDNLTIELEAGAVLSFSDNFDDYLPFVRVRYEGLFMRTFSPLFYAEGKQNLCLKGEGTLEGNGHRWWKAIGEVTAKRSGKLDQHEWSDYQALWAKENAARVDEPYFPNQFFRPPFIQFLECKNIRIEGLTLQNSPFWTINPVGCDDIHIQGVTILNPSSNPKGPNTDGINPSSCRNVRISDCFISVGDDCVTIKSGKDEDGRVYGRACENITVSNCVMLSGHGGVVIGSEMSGGVKNISISNCVFDGTGNGIRLKSQRGRGGVVENLRVNNLVMRNIQGTAFIFNLFYWGGSAEVEPVTERTPIFRNIHISNVTGVGVNQVCAMTGIEEMPVEEVSFDNVNIQAKTGFLAKTAKNIHLSNVDISVDSGPSFSFTDCDGLVLNDVRSKKPLDRQAILELKDSKNVLIRDCFQKVPTDIFSKVTDSDVIWGQNYFKNVAKVN